MTIETKYNAGQRVYFFAKGKIQHKKIYSVDIKQTDCRHISFLGFKINGNIETKIDYYIYEFGFFSENDLFTTKEELLKSLK